MMSSSSEAVEDALFLQARGIVGAEFEEWLVKLSSLLQSSERGPPCLTLLRQLYVLTAASKYRRNVSADVYKLLLSIVLEPEQGSLKVKLIAAGILAELSPSRHVAVPEFSPPVERANVPYFLPVMLSQTNAREKLSQLTPSIVEWLIAPGQEEELSLAALCTLHGLCTHPGVLETVETEQLHSISLQLASWLKQANKSSLPAPTTGISLFGSATKKQLVPVKEIDGTPSQGIFTVLSLGGHYSADQLLNVSAFSALRRWLLASIAREGGGGGRGTNQSPTESATPTSDQEMMRSSSSYTSLTPSTSLPATLLAPSPAGGQSSLTAPLVSLGPGGRSRQGLKEAAFQYCLRVIDQCERKPIKNDDAQLIDACLCECVLILDLLCFLSSSMVHTVFPKIRILYGRVTQDPVSNARLLLVLLKFFVNHGESEMYDLDGLIDLFFGKVLSVKFNDPSLAYEVIAYLVDNTEKLHTKTAIFSKFFPNILKILAWFPVTFTAEFLQLLPTFVTENTALEVLHSILDLPCLAATLQAQHILATHNPVALEMSMDSHLPYAKSLAAFQDGTYKFMFGHFLRSENGKGDTIDKLASLHHLLLDFVGHERVVTVSKVAPLMLKVFFKTVVGSVDGKVSMQLSTVLLERAVLLYDLEPFCREVRSVIAEQLLAIFHLHPKFVVDEHREILDYLGNLRALTTGGDLCYMHLVWLVGEYSHVGYDTRCSTALLNQFFGALELMAYEISLNFSKDQCISVRLVMVLMSTLAKLASRCQDLIPRALLCLDKTVQRIAESGCEQETHRILLNRANELVNVLKIPSLASAVLTPPPHRHGNKEMERQANIAHLLQITVHHLNVTK